MTRIPGERYWLPTLILLVALLLPSPAQPVQFDRAVRLADGAAVGLSALVDESATAQFIFLAENHLDRSHHEAQLAIIKALHANGRPLAIGLEMFASSSQKQLDRWVAGTMGLNEFRAVYRRDWNIPWEQYHEILLFARNHRIPLVGLNLPLAISRKVSRQGFAALSPEERRLLPTTITCNVSPAYMTFIRQAYASHGLDERAFEHFCEAQLLWNRYMAEQLRRYAARHPRVTLVALMGVGHALKKGVPDETDPDHRRYRVILPEFAGLNRGNVTHRDADYLLLMPDSTGE